MGFLALNEDARPAKSAEEVSRELQIEKGLQTYEDILLELRDGKEIEQVRKQLELLCKKKVFKESPFPRKGATAHHRFIYLVSKFHGDVVIKHDQDKNLALNYYNIALSIDDSDALLWKQVADIYVEKSEFDSACDALMKGYVACTSAYLRSYFLKKICDCLFEIGDYTLCLKYVSKALLDDPSFSRGRSIKHEIIREYMLGRNPYSMLEPLYGITSQDLLEYSTLESGIKNDESNLEPLEAKSLYDNHSSTGYLRRKALKNVQYKPETLPQNVIELSSSSWVELGGSLLNLYRDYEKDDSMLFNPIEIIVTNKNVIGSILETNSNISPNLNRINSKDSSISLSISTQDTQDTDKVNKIKRKQDIEADDKRRKSRRVLERKTIEEQEQMDSIFSLSDFIPQDVVSSKVTDPELLNLQLITNNVPRYLHEFISRILSNSNSNLTFYSGSQNNEYPRPKNNAKLDDKNMSLLNENLDTLKDQERRLIQFVNDLNRSNTGILDVMRRYVVYMIVGNSDSDTFETWGYSNWPTGIHSIITHMINCLELRQSIFAQSDGLDIGSILDRKLNRKSLNDKIPNKENVDNMDICNPSETGLSTKDSRYNQMLIESYLTLMECILDFCEDDLEARNDIKGFSNMFFDIKDVDDKKRIEGMLLRLDTHILTSLSFVDLKKEKILALRYLYNVARLSKCFGDQMQKSSLIEIISKYKICKDRLINVFNSKLNILSPSLLNEITAENIEKEIQLINLKKTILESDELFEKKEFSKVINLLNPIFLSKKGFEDELHVISQRDFIYNRMKTSEISDLIYSLIESYHESKVDIECEIASIVFLIVHSIVFFDSYGEFDDLFYDLVNMITRLIDILNNFKGSIGDLLSKYVIKLPFEFPIDSKTKELFGFEKYEDLTLFDHFISCTILFMHLGFKLSSQLDELPRHIAKKITQTRIEKAECFLTQGYMLFAYILDYVRSDNVIKETSDSIPYLAICEEIIESGRNRHKEDTHALQCYYIKGIHKNLYEPSLCNLGGTYFHEFCIRKFKELRESEIEYRFEISQCYYCVLGCELWKTGRGKNIYLTKNQPNHNKVSEYIKHSFYYDLEAFLFERMFVGDIKSISSGETQNAIQNCDDYLWQRFIKGELYQKNFLIQKSKKLVDYVLNMDINLRSITDSFNNSSDQSHISDVMVNSFSPISSILDLEFHEHFYFVMGRSRFLRVAQKSLYIDEQLYSTLLSAIEALEIDLILNNNRFYSWLSLGYAYILKVNYLIRELQAVVDKLDTIKILQKAFNCFAVCYRMMRIKIQKEKYISFSRIKNKKHNKKLDRISSIKSEHISRKIHTPEQSDGESSTNATPDVSDPEDNEIPDNKTVVKASYTAFSPKDAYKSKALYKELLLFFKSFGELCFMLTSRPFFGWFSDVHLKTKPELKTYGGYIQNNILSIRKIKLWEFNRDNDLYINCFPKEDDKKLFGRRKDASNVFSNSNTNVISNSAAENSSTKPDENRTVSFTENSSSILNINDLNIKSPDSKKVSTKKGMTKAETYDLDLKLVEARRMDQAFVNKLLNISNSFFSKHSEICLNEADKWISHYYKGIILYKHKTRTTTLKSCLELMKCLISTIEKRKISPNDVAAQHLLPAIKLVSIVCHGISDKSLTENEAHICLISVKMFINNDLDNLKKLLLLTDINDDSLSLKDEKEFDFIYPKTYSSCLPECDRDKETKKPESIFNISSSSLISESDQENKTKNNENDNTDNKEIDISYDIRSEIIDTLESLTNTSKKIGTKTVYHTKDIYLLARAYKIFANNDYKAIEEIQQLVRVYDKGFKINAYRTQFELPGRHFEHVFKYTIFYIDLLRDSQDNEKLEALHKKFSKNTDRKSSYRGQEIYERITTSLKKINFKKPNTNKLARSSSTSSIVSLGKLNNKNESDGLTLQQQEKEQK